MISGEDDTQEDLYNNMYLLDVGRTGLQSHRMTAHPPLYNAEVLKAKSESDSDVSPGIIETSSDFENMQTNKNFGTIGPTSKFCAEMSAEIGAESEFLFSHNESIVNIVNEMGVKNDSQERSTL